jgi:hypothetical protein
LSFLYCEFDSSAFHAHIIGEEFVGGAAHFIAGFEWTLIVRDAFHDPAEFEARNTPSRPVHMNQNQTALRLNHGHNLPAAAGRRVGQKVYF